MLILEIILYTFCYFLFPMMVMKLTKPLWTDRIPKDLQGTPLDWEEPDSRVFTIILWPLMLASFPLVFLFWVLYKVAKSI